MKRSSKSMLWAAGGLAAVGAAAAATKWFLPRTTTERLGLPPLETVSWVDLQQYAGKWYEIAAFPHRFEAGCIGATATYSLRSDGTLEVLNECWTASDDPRPRRIHGVAKVIDPGTNAKLEVKFFPLLSGEYWIIDLGPDYEYAVVGHPSRDYLWILSRAPRLDRWIYDEIIEGVAAQGYEVERLRATKQPRVPTERYFHGAPTNLIKAVYAGP